MGCRRWPDRSERSATSPAGQHSKGRLGRGQNDVGIDDVRGACPSEKRADLLGLSILERRDLAAAEEATQLDLVVGAADLSDDWCGRRRHETKLKSSTVICPRGPAVAFSCDHHSSVVEHERGVEPPDLRITKGSWSAPVFHSSE
jgi:hypothetical protein